MSLEQKEQIIGKKKSQNLDDIDILLYNKMCSLKNRKNQSFK